MNKKITRSIFILLVSAVLILVYIRNGTPGFSAKKDGILSVTFFDVGQGDAILLTTDYSAILIDSGTDSSEEKLLGTLSAMNVDTIALFFITHGDSDHAGGGDCIVRNLCVDKIFTSNLSGDSESLVSIKRASAERGTALSECQRGDRLISGNVQIEVLSPGASLSGDDNSDSLVLLVTYGTCSFLLMGDADTTAEKDILRYCTNLPRNCDVIKAGHHGSRTSSSEEWLSAVNPAYCVISCGKANNFGHPNADVVSRYERIGSVICRTDRLGDITFVCDGNSVELKT